MDPLAGSAWSAPGTVAGFATAPPNPVLTAFAAAQRTRARGTRLLDIGCGAARNALPLAAMGWDVVGLDLSTAMLRGAAEKAAAAPLTSRLDLLQASAEALPLADASVDFILAHGIWNLLPTAVAFRRAVAEAGRVARPGAALFVFTFSRHTFPDEVLPVPGEPFVFTEFSGQPQCFLTDAQLHAEMAAAGFVPDPGVPLTEYNRPRSPMGGPPVIYEAAYRRT
jgi:ubiquinone/menaquinone biosynthesis C-methylase UbiE